MTVARKDHHIWAQNALAEIDWTYMYQIVLNTNIALETVDKQKEGERNSARANYIRGQAYFFRASAFYQLLQYYATPYDKTTAAGTPGIALRLTSDATPVSTRATLENSWHQLLDDFKAAIDLLPVTNSPVTRPSKGTAYAALARAYLDMGEYALAGKYADSALRIKSTLLNFNAVDGTQAYPFDRYNTEVLISSVMQYIGPQSPTNYKVDSLLYRSYELNDLRRTLFFKSNGVGTVGFRGGYDGTSTPFNGLANDEVYLIRAEAAARAGLKDSALSDLNKLLVTRWVTGTFVPFTAGTADQALDIILTERRKELILRGTRWFDLRRLNKETRFATTLIRMQNSTTYTLPPNDNRYTFLIPAQVIALTGMQQNTR
jgi:tetratricopeptide (TPR) repeat protein